MEMSTRLLFCRNFEEQTEEMELMPTNDVNKVYGIATQLRFLISNFIDVGLK